MSLESLTPDERRQIEAANASHKLLGELLSDGDPEVRKSAMRLAKKKRPDLRFAELEAEEAATAASKGVADEVKALRSELETERAMRLKAEEAARIRERGYDPERVYTLMTEKGIANLDTMLNVLDADAQLAESTGGSVRPMKNPAAELLKDVKPGEPVDVEALRGKLIDTVVGEMHGRRTNPLSFLHPAQ